MNINARPPANREPNLRNIRTSANPGVFQISLLIHEYDWRLGGLWRCTNSLDLIGKIAIVNGAMDYTFSNHLTRIRVNKKVILPYWLYLLLLRYKERAVFRAICNTHVGQSGIVMVDKDTVES